MNKWNLWRNIVFKTTSYRKNFDISIPNENYITEHDGKITIIRYDENKYPLTIGEYGISIWNLKLGKLFNVDFHELLENHRIENTYYELINLMNDNVFDINQYDKILLIHSFVLCEKYRKHDVVDEFVEMVYRDYYDEHTAILMLVRPFQDNEIDAEYYLNIGKVGNKEDLDSDEETIIPTTDYYSLNDFLNNDDTEINEYKLFAIASRCGFRRLGESYIFQFSPDKILERLENKQKLDTLIDNNDMEFL